MLKTIAIGRVVEDAKVFYYNDGQGSGVSFNLACDVGFGENKDTNFIKCTVFGRDENTAQYIQQGNIMNCEGNLDIRWDKEHNQTYIQLIVKDFEFGPKKR